MQEERHRVKRRRFPLGRLCLVAAVALALGRPRPAAALPGTSDPPEADTTPTARPSPIGPLAYTPGRGLRLGDVPVTLGGYTNVNLTRDEGHAALLDWDDLSLFIIADPLPRLHLFSEVEFEDLVQVDTDGHGGSFDGRFIAERLYGDLTISDEVNLRVGKFLTPIGRWNVIHAQPLIWTTSRPLATVLPFDLHTTGAMLFGSLPRTDRVTYSLFGQFVNQLDRVPDGGQPADRSGGVHLDYATRDGGSVGASYLTFTRHGAWQHTVGLDTLWQRGPVDLMGEFVFEDSPDHIERQWGLYLQNVIELTAKFYLVGRYEHFAQRRPDPEVNLFALGVAYKPLPPIILKAEYLFADHPAAESPPGFKCSFAILF